MRQSEGRCAALRGKVGVSCRCACYDRRPDVCADFAPGSEQCLEARTNVLAPGENAMTTEEADEMLAKIADMAQAIEDDEELKQADPRYAIVAKWIDVDLNNVDAPA